jgi:pimeloyl-ACP methyl ester carboxylesterase
MVKETSDRRYFVKCVNPDSFHRMAVREYGDQNNPEVILCVHGLTRNGHDFDMIAQELAKEYRVLVPDLVGRGASEWLRDKRHYTYEQYVRDLTLLIATTGASQVDWLGTSLGGTIAFEVAWRAGQPIRNLVCNDIAPYIRLELVERIAFFLGSTPLFADQKEIKSYLQQVYAAFGNLDDEHWEHIARFTTGKRDGQKLRLAFDPAISYSLIEEYGGKDKDQWQYWEKMSCQTLVIHGLKSVILTLPEVERMKTTGPKADVLTIEDAGHAPPLMCPEQIKAVCDWLLNARLNGRSQLAM